MRLGGRATSLPPSTDVATALRVAAEQLGHRPALTVVRPDGREEQGFASLAQWAAKGAHLLELDQLLEPGMRVAVTGPPGWMPAAVALAAWWAGLVVVVDGPADTAVVHETATAPDANEVLWTGDAPDGSPIGDVPGEAYAVAVQAFPDQPPPPRAAPDQPALLAGGRSWTQTELLDTALSLAEPDATLGLETLDRPELWLPAVAVRPLVTGRPTVVLRDVDHERAAGEGVTAWR